MNVFFGIKNYLLVFFNYLKSHGFVAFLFAAVVFFVLLFLFFPKSPATPKEPFGTIPYRQTKTTANENLSLEKITFKPGLKTVASLPVYRLKQASEDETLALFNDLVRELGSSSSAKIIQGNQEKSFLLSEEKFLFSGNILTGYFTFTGEGRLDLSGSTALDIETSLWKMLVSLNLVSLVDKTPRVSYLNYDGGEYIESQATAVSDAISFVYIPKVGGVPVIGLGAAEMPLRIIVDRNAKKIVRIDYSLPKVELKNSGEYRLLSLSEIAALPVSGLTFVSLFDENGSRAANYSLSDVSSFAVTKINVYYFIEPQKQGLLSPLYYLTGEAVLKDKRKGTMTVSLPAIKNSVVSP